MLGKESKQPSFADLMAAGRLSDRHFLMQIDAAIDWQPFEKKLAKLYHPSIGRPGYPPLMLFKALLLQQWYGLSDPEMEEAIGDRLSFQRFLRLSLHESVPDETTICKFRGLLARRGLTAKLFQRLNAQLEEKGLVVRRGTLIDASLIKANAKPPAKGKEGSDPEAAYAARPKGAPVYGYKAHVAVDQGSELIRSLDLTPANVHDTERFVSLVMGDEQAVFADKGYAKDGRKRVLRKFGIFCGILDKARRNQPLSPRQKRRNQRVGRIRQAVERSFATLKGRYELGRVRYRGLMRNLSHLYLVAMAMNLRRMLRLAAA